MDIKQKLGIAYFVFLFLYILEAIFIGNRISNSIIFHTRLLFSKWRKTYKFLNESLIQEIENFGIDKCYSEKKLNDIIFYEHSLIYPYNCKNVRLIYRSTFSRTYTDYKNNDIVVYINNTKIPLPHYISERLIAYYVMKVKENQKKMERMKKDEEHLKFRNDVEKNGLTDLID